MTQKELQDEEKIKLKEFFLYRITNIINKKMYFGQTICLKTRWAAHKNIKKHHPLYNSMKYYGKEKFIIEIINNVFTQEEADNLEIYYIAKYNTTNRNFEYNISAGGQICKASYKQVNPSIAIGKKLSEQHIENLSKSHIGWKPTEEYKQKRSEIMLNKRPIEIEEKFPRKKRIRKGKNEPKDTKNGMYGKKSPGPKLNQQQANEIRILYEGLSNQADLKCTNKAAYISKIYNVSESAIRSIIQYKTHNDKILSGNAKLTNNQVKDIRDKYTKGNISMRQLALEFNISVRSISNVINLNTYKDV